MRDTIAHVAAISIRLAVLALARRGAAPLDEIVATSRTMYCVCSDGKRHKHTVDSHRMEERTKQSPSSSPVAPAVPDESVVTRRCPRSKPEPACQCTSSLVCDLG